MKLPRFLVPFFRPKKLRPPVFRVYVLSRLLVTPAMQNMTPASNRQAMAAHMKPKAYLPRDAGGELVLKFLRPMTYAALNLFIS